MIELTKEEKLKRIKKSMDSYNKEAEKKGLNSKAGFANDFEGFGEVKLIKTGIYKLDKLIGGIPRGRYTEIYGPASAGKSTLIERIMGEFQKQDLVVALANNERNYESKWAAKQGLNLDELVGGNFSDLEECLNFSIDMAETDGACDLLTIDTITAISSKMELQTKKSEGTRSLDDDTMALIARKLSQFFRMATTKVSDSKMALILVNQVRSNIGSYGGGMEAPGGNALKHNLSLNLRVTRSKCKKSGFEDSHFIMNVKVEKSKFLEAKEQSSCEIAFKLGEGIDNTFDMIMDGIDFGIINKKAASYEYKTISARGYNNFAKNIEEDKDLYNELLIDLSKSEGNINESKDEEINEEEKLS